MIKHLKNKKSPILQFAKISLLSGLVFIFVILVTVSLLTWIYRDTVKERFISQINKNLQTEVFIHDITVDFFRSFPLTSISLRNVTIMETPGVQPRDTMLHAKRVYFQFSVFSLLRKDFTVKRAEVIEGFVHMKYFSDATNNFTFWKVEADNTREDTDFEFNIQRVVFSQMAYRYTDYKEQHDLSFKIDKATVSGNFTGGSYLLSARGDMLVKEIKIDDAFMVGNQQMNFDFYLDVVDNNVFTFKQGVFKLGSHSFLAQGSIDISGPDTWVDLYIDARELKLENVINDLPPQYARYLKGYKSNGQMFFKAAITGTFASDVNPYISADFGISEGDLYHRSANLKFTGISFEGSFNNGSGRQFSSSTLVLNNFSAILNNGQIKGNAVINNLLEPNLDVKLFSSISAGEWQKILQSEKITSASGDLLIDVEFKGKMGENRLFTAYHFMASKVTGEITTKDLSFRLANDPLDYHNINGDFLFNNNDIIIRKFDGRASASDFDMKGYFRNVLPWLFFDNQRLFVNASLVSNNLNFNELLQFSVSESDTTYRLRLSEMIDFRFQADIEKLTFRKFYGEKVKGRLTMREQMFYASDFSLSTMKGTILASGYINGKNPDVLQMGCEAQFNNVDVNDLFFQMGNFGQQSIEHHNLRGRITADARFISLWSPYLDIDWDALDVTANIRIDNGELINYKPMLALSRFIRVGDLNQVKFSTLENQIRIKNQKILIPDMEINSNALNIKLSGEHSFDNEIDYRLQVLLSDLLARRNRESRNPQEQYGDIIDDGLGRTTLFLRVTGTIDEPVFRYDIRGVREKIKEDFRKEGQNLRQVIRSEFGLGKTDTLPDGSLAVPDERQMEKNDIRKGEKGKFTIEWDD